MKTVRTACQLQPNALDIHVGDQIEQLDQLIQDTDGHRYFAKTFITEGMHTLLRKGLARLAGQNTDAIFHLKQAMGGGKTHLMVGLGLMAKDPHLRAQLLADQAEQGAFGSAQIAAFNGRNNPSTYFWGEIARQLGQENLFTKYWEAGPKAPDEVAWIELFSGEQPTLILLDEMPPYFHYYSTQTLGQGTVADVVTRAFANMLTAAQKKNNVCIVVSDLEAAYATGGRLIQQALDDATQELGRAEIGITPVNLESSEIYAILRKRLFLSLPAESEVAEIAEAYARRLAEAAKAKTVERSAEALAQEIADTYPFHPGFKSLVALFKENEKFKQTRGLMELVSRLLKSVWESSQDIYLIGAQHFDLALPEVREKLADISEMRDVIAKDLWDANQGAHAQVIDLGQHNTYAQQVGTLLLTASLSTAINAVKGLSESEMFESLIDPVHPASLFKQAFAELSKTAWYLHQTQEGRSYFDHQENLTKKLQGYAEKAPQNKVDELIRHRLLKLYQPTTKEAYEKVLPLPEMEEVEAALKTLRALVIVSPDGKTPPEVVQRFYRELVNKNNLLVLTGDKSSMASLEKAARHVYAATKASAEIRETHPQRKELEEKQVQYDQDFQTTLLNLFDKLLFPSQQAGEDILRTKVLDSTYPAHEAYQGERQVIKTLTQDPLKLYTHISAHFDALRSRAESLLFGGLNEARKSDLLDRLKQKTQMPWLPPKGLDLLLQEACQRGLWEDLGNGMFTKKPRPKTTEVMVIADSSANDQGEVRLKVEAINAGTASRIHYQEDAPVTLDSPLLTEQVLVTQALRVQFLAVDPTGKNQTGTPQTWSNSLVLRNWLDEATRTVSLFVAPRGQIRYSLDGSEPRNGTVYTEPITIGSEATTLYVFAECDGLETRRNFSFAASGSKEIVIVRDKPAQWVSAMQKKLDGTAKTYAALKFAKARNISFEQVSLMLGMTPRLIHLNLVEMPVDADFIERTLAHFQPLLPPEAPVVMSFKKVSTPTGYDLELFAQEMGIELVQSEVIQS